MSDEVTSPCVQVCQMDPQTGCCIGCMRTLDEIADWLEMSNQEKKEVLARIEQRRERVA